MPHILFRGTTAEQLKTISKSLVEELAMICECSTDNFTFNALSIFISDKKHLLYVLNHCLHINKEKYIS
ncbi:MAG: DUF1904 family protein [Bacillus sp. (in: firmicutes)]